MSLSVNPISTGAPTLEWAHAVKRLELAGKGPSEPLADALLEIERLRHDIERHVKIASDLATENEALRGQLECQAAKINELDDMRQEAQRQLVNARPARERVAETIGWYLACVVAGNNQPHMSGDPRNRVPPGKRRSFDDACLACADAILSLFDDQGSGK